ncbi:hypothetical protein [Paenibacillus chitinolyticus]
MDSFHVPLSALITKRSPVARWTVEKLFGKDAVDALVSNTSKITSWLDRYLYAVELSVNELGALARQEIPVILKNAGVSKGIAETTGQVVEWIIKFSYQILL